MRLKELAEALKLECLTPEIDAGGREISSGYVSDLLSDVLAHGPSGGALVTVQVHLNVVAVALHADMSAVVFAHDRRPDEPVRARAIEEGVPLFVSRESAFDLVGRLYGLGVRGPQA